MNLRQLWLGLVAVLVGLCACAPAPARSQGNRAEAHLETVPSVAKLMRASFSPQGAVWVASGRACVARSPDFLPVCSALGRVADVAWHAGKAWAALPELGLVITLDGAPQSISAGAVAALSSQFIYRQDGSALNYEGQLASEALAGRPSLVVTGGDGQDYALLAGRWVRAADGGLTALLTPHLLVTPTGVQPSLLPSVTDGLSLYQLQGGQLERLDSSGKLLASVPSDGVAVGLLGPQVLTLSAIGELKRFSSDLKSSH